MIPNILKELHPKPTQIDNWHLVQTIEMFLHIQLPQEGHISLQNLSENMCLITSAFGRHKSRNFIQTVPKITPKDVPKSTKTRTKSGSKGVQRGVPNAPGSPTWMPGDPKWSLQGAKVDPPGSHNHVFLYEMHGLPKGNPATVACSPSLLLTGRLLTQGPAAGPTP